MCTGRFKPCNIQNVPHKRYAQYTTSCMPSFIANLLNIFVATFHSYKNPIWRRDGSNRRNEELLFSSFECSRRRVFPKSNVCGSRLSISLFFSAINAAITFSSTNLSTTSTKNAYDIYYSKSPSKRAQEVTVLAGPEG